MKTIKISIPGFETDLIAEVDSIDDIMDVDFDGAQLCRIEKRGEAWIVTNAMNGWGINNFEAFHDSVVEII